jgi:CNT family concentrative nucleoside transporter
MDAIVRGTAAGLELLLNICAMLIVLVALVHLANAIIGVSRSYPPTRSTRARG